LPKSLAQIAGSIREFGFNRGAAGHRYTFVISTAAPAGEAHVNRLDRAAEIDTADDRHPALERLAQ
jgi:hypothetical protein